ncbi:MAG TPA: type II toxin-antitoxin system HicB family antitoxin [Thermoanaerobaculia bacterium]
MPTPTNIVVERHPDAYPLGIKGVVVGEGQTHEEALVDVRSAIGFHLESFGRDALEPKTALSSGPGSADGGPSG